MVGKQASHFIELALQALNRWDKQEQTDIRGEEFALPWMKMLRMLIYKSRAVKNYFKLKRLLNIINCRVCNEYN